MPELPLPLLALDRLAVGVVTETDVELLTDPSVAVTTMIFVDVLGVGVAVVELDFESDVVSAEEAVVEVAASDEVEEGVGSLFLDVEGVGVIDASEVESGAVVAAEVVGSAVVEGWAVVFASVDVVGSAVVVDSAVVFASVEVALGVVLAGALDSSDVAAAALVAGSSGTVVAAGAAVLPAPLAATSVSALRASTLLD